MARPKVEYQIRAVDKTSEGINKVKSKLSGLKSAFAAIGVGAAAAGIARFTVSAAKAADEVAKVAQRLGTSTEALSQLQFAAQQSGVSINTLNLGLQRMVRRVAEAAQGTGEAQDALRQLGINAEALARLNPDQQFRAIAQALEGVGSQSEKVRLAFKLFDSEGVALLQTLEGGVAALDAYRSEAAALGITLSTDVAGQATAVVDSIGRMRAQFQAAGHELIRIFGPAVQLIVRLIGDGLVSAAQEAGRATVFLRERLVSLAAVVADAFGQEEAATSLRALAESYTSEFVRITEALEGYTVELGEAVKAQDLFDDSLKNFTATTEVAKKAQAELNKEAADAKALFDQTRFPLEKLRIEQERLNVLLEKGAISWEVYSRAIVNAFNAYEAATEKFERATEEIADNTSTLLKEIRTEIEGFSRDLVDTLTDSTKSIKDIFEDLALTLAKLAFKRAVTDPLVGFLGGILDSVFKSVPASQAGGPANRGQPRLVGESGPELFTPNSSGMITPNNELGGGGVNINFTVNSLDPRTAADVIVANRNVIVGVVRGAFNRAGTEPRLA